MVVFQNCNDDHEGRDDDEDNFGDDFEDDNYHWEGGGGESNPGLWIPKEDTLPTVYMTIR